MQKIRQGFTLVELLVVVAIIGVLLGLVSGAVQKTVNVAKEKRCEAEMRTLAAAIETYRHDYNQWPMRSQERAPGTVVYYDSYDSSSPPNYHVFDFLAGDNSDGNPKGKTYLDYNALYMKDDKGKIVTVIRYLNEKYGGDWAKEKVRLVDHKGIPYRVAIDLIYNRVSVTRK